MHRFILAVLALIVLLVAILVVAPGLIPVGAYKARVEAAASQTVGRTVTFGENIQLKIIPRTGFRVNDLEIANAEGFDAPYLAHVKSAEIGVKLFPLFRGAVEVDRFILTEPDINLARAKDGRVNWDLASAKEPAAESSTGELNELKLGDVRIVDGKAAYADAAAGKKYAASDIDIALRLASLSEPLEAKGTMTFEGAPSRVDLVLTSLAALMRKEDANLKLDVALGAMEAGADVVVKTKDALSYSGPVKFNAPDLRAFAALIGSPIPQSPGFDKLAVDGVASGDANGVRLSGAKIKFDAIDAAGDLALGWTGPRPKATGRLSAGSLDLRPYLPPPTESAQGFPAWSEDKLDFSGLKNIDADIEIAADKIFLNDLEFGQSRMRLEIADGRMTADIPELDLYGGGGSGQLVVNARTPTPTIAGKFDISSVDAQPFSLDLMKTDRLLGLGGLKIDFTASGSSQAAIMRSLDGSGGFDVADGALKGINLVKLANSIEAIYKGGLNPTAITAAVAAAQRPDEETDFSQLLSQFSIKDGLVSAPTISMNGPYLTLVGVGDVNLPGQTLDLRLAPRVTSTIDGAGGTAFTIPLRVSGSFSKPKPEIDLAALAKGQGAQFLRGLIDSFGKKDEAATGPEGAKKEDAALKVLEGVLGGTKPAEAGEATDAGEAGAPPTLKDAVAEEALKQLFGKKKPAESPPPAEEPKQEDEPE